jgi:hypothetical protein
MPKEGGGYAFNGYQQRIAKWTSHFCVENERGIESAEKEYGHAQRVLSVLPTGLRGLSVSVLPGRGLILFEV